MYNDASYVNKPATIGDRLALTQAFRVNRASLQERTLPRQVLFCGQGIGATDGLSGAPVGMLEFATVIGNAAYRAGERFYLPAGKAMLAYGVTL